jgi:hypothetical protein
MVVQLEGGMMSRSAVYACIAILVPTGAFACDVPALTDNMDRLKGSDSELAGTIALECAAILKDPGNVTSLANLILAFKAGLGGDTDAALTIDNCTPEEIRSAC